MRKTEVFGINVPELGDKPDITVVSQAIIDVEKSSRGRIESLQSSAEGNAITLTSTARETNYTKYFNGMTLQFEAPMILNMSGTYTITVAPLDPQPLKLKQRVMKGDVITVQWNDKDGFVVLNIAGAGGSTSKITVTQENHGFNYNAVRFDTEANKWVLAKSPNPCEGIAVPVDTNTFDLVMQGFIDVTANITDSKGEIFEHDEYYFLPDGDSAEGSLQKDKNTGSIFQSLVYAVRQNEQLKFYVDVQPPFDMSASHLTKENLHSYGIASTDDLEAIKLEWGAIEGKPQYFPTKWDMVDGKPENFINPYALTVQLNGSNWGSYDGSKAMTLNITPTSIGAYTKAESDVNYLRRYPNSITLEQVNNAGLADGIYNTTNAGIISGYGNAYTIIHAGTNGNNNNLQLISPVGAEATNSELFIRVDKDGTWKSAPRRVWTDGNFNPNSKFNSNGGTISGNVSITGSTTTKNLQVNGTINSTGLITSQNDVVAFSDRELKTEIEDINVQETIDKIMQVRMKHFKYKHIEDDHIRTGVIAQELEDIYPELIHKTISPVDENKEVLAVAYQGLLLECIAIIQSHEERIKKLEKLLKK